MKHNKKWLIMGIVVLAVIAVVFGGYHIFCYPALFRNLSDRSLDETQTEKLRKEILSRPDTKILIAPAADGSPTAVTVFEKSDYLLPSAPEEFQLKEVERLKGDRIRLTYLVRKRESQDGRS